MKIKDRDKHIERLDNLWNASKLGVDAGSLRCWFLSPHYFKGIVQIAECFDKDGKEVPVPRHKHDNSYEIFIQLEGETYFVEDDSILKEHETKVLPPGVDHTVIPRKGSKLIVIIHPPDEVLKA